MATFDVFIVPAIWWGLSCIVLMGLAIWMARKRVTLWKAQKAREQIPVRLLYQQRDAIDTVIAEMTAHPSVSLSQNTQDALFAAHAAANSLGGGISRR